MAPAEGGKDQQESDRSFGGSDNGLSSHSGKGKARVTKVTRRPQTTKMTSRHEKEAVDPREPTEAHEKAQKSMEPKNMGNELALETDVHAHITIKMKP